MLVVLVIVAVLAVVALPMAETRVQRDRELELRDTLRTVRTALDRFNGDWRDGVMATDASGVSENGYPERLQVLVDGIEAEDDDAARLRYLRRMPQNPFTGDRRPLEDHWRFIGYDQSPDERTWDGKDIYDLRPATDRKALDGSDIQDW